MAEVVVYIDDEPALCRIAGLLLRAAGFDARTFTDAEEARAFLDQGSPVSVVVCDQRMPRLTGQELLAGLGRDVPFVFVTGDHSAAEDAPVDQRVRAVVEKPFSFPDLIDLLRALPPPRS